MKKKTVKKVKAEKVKKEVKKTVKKEKYVTREEFKSFVDLTANAHESALGVMTELGKLLFSRKSFYVETLILSVCISTLISSLLIASLIK